jgi:hypothetical protein
VPWRSDLLVDIQSKLGVEVRNVFSDVLDLKLLSALQAHLHPVRTMLSESSQKEEQRHQTLLSKLGDNMSTLHLDFSASNLTSGQQHDAILSAIRNRDENLSQGVETLKEHISAATGFIQSTEFRIHSKNHGGSEPDASH